MDKVYVMEQFGMSNEFESPNYQAGMPKYHYRRLILARLNERNPNSLDMKIIEVEDFDSKVVVFLKALSDKGHPIVLGLHPSFPERADFDAHVEKNRGFTQIQMKKD